MLAAVDVDYRNREAVAACVLFASWTSAAAVDERRLVIHDVQDYQPGEFYRRELPCLLQVSQPVLPRVSTIVVDGYAWLPATRSEQEARLLESWAADGCELPVPAGCRPGLGAWLYRELRASIPVIGVAKSRFRDDTTATIVYRGGSKQPLYVTSVGMSQQDAADGVRTMHGEHRLPTMLKLVDRQARSKTPVY